MIILTNLQLTDKGDYDVVVANACGSVTSRVVNLSVDPTFTKITAGPVVTDRANFVYGSWADYNGDGFSDLFVPAGADVLNQSPYLYQNLGGTNFVRMTASDVGMLVGSWPYCYQGLWADFNNDGLLDLLEIGGPASGISSANRLFLGNATHTFQRIQNVGENTPVWAWQCALLDYNNDGAVDVCYPTGWRDLNSKGSIYRNLGDGSFTHAWSATGPVFDNQYASCPDYDNDGDPDLWLTGGDGVNTTGQFYRNIQNGSFELVSDGSIPTSASIDSAWGDYDNDGYLDCANGVKILHNNAGTGLTVAATLPYVGWSRWGDYDNDGDLDLVNGSYGQTINRFYRNDGGGLFTPVHLGSPSVDIPASQNLNTWADFDNDGFLDLFVGTRGYPSGSNFLYRNSGLTGGNTNRWLIVKPRGIASNGSAIGAKVRVQAAIRGNVVWQMRQITGGYYDDLRAHFGLGDATNVTTLRIEWPSGIVQELQNVPANTNMTIVESQAYPGAAPQFNGATNTAGGLQLGFSEPAAGARYILEASTDLVTWTKLLARTSAGAAAAQFTDTRSTNYTRRFYRLQVP